MSRASQVDSHFDILKFFPDMTDIIACKKALKWIDVPTSRLKIFLERKARAVDFFVFPAPTTGTGNVKRRSTRNSTEWTPNCTTAT